MQEQRCLGPVELEGLKGMSLRFRRMSDSGTTGRHATSRTGSSIEFAQHREYAPGDELRHIDWKAYGRSERMVVKQYESEISAHTIVVLDVSQSMFFNGGGVVDKISFATRIAHGLSWVLLHQGDSVGLATFSNGEPFFLPPSASGLQLSKIEVALKEIVSGATTSFDDLARFLTTQKLRRANVFLITDLLSEESHALQRVVSTASPKATFCCIQVLSPDERYLNAEDPTIFVDEETQSEVLTEPEAIQNAYEQSITQWLNETASVFSHHGIPYLLQLSDGSAVGAIKEVGRLLE